MKLKITLMPEPGDDLAVPFMLSGIAMQYPATGHIVVDAKHVTLASDEYETLGSENRVHAEGATELIAAPPIETGTRLTTEGMTAVAETAPPNPPVEVPPSTGENAPVAASDTLTAADAPGA